MYLKCREQVKEEKAYLDTFPCVNREGGDYMYAVVGDLSADGLTPECSVKMVTAIASNWRNLVSDGRMRTYSDVHNVTSFGFELSWRERVCVDFKCPQGNVCFFTMGGESPICLPDDSSKYHCCSFLLDKNNIVSFVKFIINILRKNDLSSYIIVTFGIAKC